MSSSTTNTPSESSIKKAEDSTVPSKSDSTISNEDKVKDNVLAGKMEQPAQTPVTNGALPDSVELKVVGNGIESPTNGQEEKPASDGPHREVPALLPLGNTITPPPPTVQATQQPSILPTLNPNPSTSTRQPLPQLLPMKTTATPVVATKSAPPPPPSNPVGKTRGRNSSAPFPSSSPSKEAATPSVSLRSKKETIEEDEVPEKETKKRKPVSTKRNSVASSDSTEKGDVDSGGDGDLGRKSKRARTRTQPFQSSDVDANLLRVIKASAAAQTVAAAQQAKANEEKLVVFFKGEFLAVRNAEGGFYICQAMQNINRGNHKIRIRWLSQAAKEDVKNKKKAKTTETTEPVKDESGFDIYTPDFYDNTDFECILTNLELEKLGRDRYGLPHDERQRTENILRRAIEVEQGVVDKLELTEEHPDGLDVSLFHDESQLKRKRRQGKKNDGSNSDSESESDSKEEIATTSGSSGKSSQSTEPEPRTSTSGVASTSSGRGAKRTRAATLAATRQKLQQMRYRDEEDDDSSDDVDDDDEEDSEEEESSSESESGKRRRRGRPLPKRARPAPVSKARASARSVRGKKLISPKKGPIPMMKRTKASYKQPVEIIVHRRKADDDDEDPPSPLEKVVTVDVEMGDNETPVEEPKEVKNDPLVTEEKDAKKKSEVEIPNTAESLSADVNSEKTSTDIKDEKVAETSPEIKSVPKMDPAKTEEVDAKTKEPEKEKVDEEKEKTVKDIVEKEKSEVKATEPKD